MINIFYVLLTQMSRSPEGKVLCKCNSGKEVISALSFNFAPNTIDFNSVFSKFDISAQGAVLGTILAVAYIAMIFMCWASFMDRRGVLQVSYKSHFVMNMRKVLFFHVSIIRFTYVFFYRKIIKTRSFLLFSSVCLSFC